MPFQYILTDLLASNDEAVGAVFLDESGETVDVVCAQYTPHQMRIVGAYLGIYLRQLGKLTQETELGEPEVLQVTNAGLHIFAVPMPDGYCLALLQRNPALVGPSRRSLVEAGRQIQRELFRR